MLRVNPVRDDVADGIEAARKVEYLDGYEGFGRQMLLEAFDAATDRHAELVSDACLRAMKQASWEDLDTLVIEVQEYRTVVRTRAKVWGVMAFAESTN